MAQTKQVSIVDHTDASTLGKGDISTLQKRGHFYFALTDFRENLRLKQAFKPFFDRL